jgi:hypothetical protein
MGGTFWQFCRGQPYPGGLVRLDSGAAFRENAVIRTWELFRIQDFVILILPPWSLSTSKS